MRPCPPTFQKRENNLERRVEFECVSERTTIVIFCFNKRNIVKRKWAQRKMCDAMMIPCHNKNFSLPSYVLLFYLSLILFWILLRSNFFYDARKREWEKRTVVIVIFMILFLLRRLLLSWWCQTTGKKGNDDNMKAEANT